jgi:hypothetical protein
MLLILESGAKFRNTTTTITILLAHSNSHLDYRQVQVL